MSDFTEVAILIALFVAGAFVYVLMDRLIQGHYDAIETGVIRGVSMSIRYRRLLLTTRLVPAIFVLVFILSFIAIGYMLLAKSIDDEDVRLFAYLGVFLTSIGAFGWLVVASFVCIHLASRIREAERG